MTNNDLAVSYSQFKYDLFEANSVFLNTTYFNDNNRNDSLDFFNTLINGKDSKYYRSNYITNKILAVIGETSFIECLSIEEQSKILSLIRDLLKSNKTIFINPDKLYIYRERIVNEYLLIQSIINNQQILSLSGNDLKLLKGFLQDYTSFFSKDDLLLNKLEKYLKQSTQLKNNHPLKVKCYFYRQYLLFKMNKMTRSLKVK